MGYATSHDKNNFVFLPHKNSTLLTQNNPLIKIVLLYDLFGE